MTPEDVPGDATALRAAAEAILNGGSNNERADELLQKFARAHLADHPADDGELPDGDWLRAAGGKKQFTGDYSFFGNEGEDKPKLWIDIRPGKNYAVIRIVRERQSMFAFADAETRGHVRRLLAALGVTTAENRPAAQPAAGGGE
jgi:hypothetical protein